jgi:hypothetical protein
MDKYTVFFDGIMLAEEPLTVTHKEAQVGKAHSLPRSGKHPEAKPYWPGCNLRGALRHAIATIAAEASADNGKKFGIAEFFMVSQGTDINAIVDANENKISVDADKKLRETNPVLSLLGRWKLQSKMDIGNAYPTSIDCVAYYGQGARGIVFEKNTELYDEIDDDEKIKLEKLLFWQSESSNDKQEIKKEIVKLKKAWKESNNDAEKRLLNEQIRAKEEDQAVINKGGGEGGASGIRRPLQGYEAFNANTEFKQRITLHNVTKLEIGLFIAGLRKFSRNPRVGAKSSLNNGLVSFDWTVLRYMDDKSLMPTETGKISVSYSGGVAIADDLLKEGYDAWCGVESNLQDFDIDLTVLV